MLLVSLLLGTVSLSALASNGKGKGLATAPGQDPAFDRGITTIVTSVTAERTDELVEVTFHEDSESFTVTLTQLLDETTDVNSTTFIEYKQLPNGKTQDREVTTTTTTFLVTHRAYTLTTTITVSTVTPVTITETVTTTERHGGAPGSNGERLDSTITVEEINRVYGEPVASEDVDDVLELVDEWTETKVEVQTDTQVRTGPWGAPY